MNICTKAGTWKAFDRETRLDLVKKEAITEYVARTALARVIGNSNLWQHFANTPALGSFWALPAPTVAEFGVTPLI